MPCTQALAPAYPRADDSGPQLLQIPDQAAVGLHIGMLDQLGQVLLTHTWCGGGLTWVGFSRGVGSGRAGGQVGDRRPQRGGVKRSPDVRVLGGHGVQRG